MINKVKDNNNLKYPKVSAVEDSLVSEKEDVGADADVEDKLAQRLKALEDKNQIEHMVYRN